MVVVLHGTCSLRRLCNYLWEPGVGSAALLLELLITLPSGVSRKQFYISVVSELNPFSAVKALSNVGEI